ncbi:hypothetical protein F53441_10615 [Fusarium austroafricanum]|uniref:C2H2-type domain-containing protein n=1 Tax=Fusarium austroafricanum TaxID=2364996 RepID=A0A8H4NV75_9HYPO|nr:hypothetical protein F53441_10615 [Fusarium austroafricanum]
MNDRTLAEVDGLFAGFIYLDEAEPIQHKNPRGGYQHHLALELNDLYNSCNAAPIYGYNTSDPAQTFTISNEIGAREVAWSSIRTVREGIQVLWDHFDYVSRSLKMPAINNIHASYQGPEGLRQAGLFALRNILAGPIPKDLARVFAFCSLSYVVSRLLYTRGKLLEGDILAGVREWSGALEKEDERAAFETLVRRLWPEAQSHLHAMNRNLDPPQQAAGTLQGSSFSAPYVYYENPASPFVDIGLQPGASLDQQAHSSFSYQGNQRSFSLPLEADNRDLVSLDLDIEASDMPTLYAQNLAGLADSICDFSRSTSVPPMPDTRPWSDSGSIHSLNFDTMNSMDFPAQTNTHNPPTANPHYEPDDRLLLGPTTNTDNLQNSSVFTAMLEYLRESCHFWFELAGRGLVSRDHQSCDSWCHDRSGQKKQLQTLYIQRLLSKKPARDSASRGIVSIVDKFVEWGFLQSIEDTKFYMERVGDLLFDEQTDCQEFKNWIRSCQEKKKSRKRKHTPCPDSDCSYTSSFPSNVKRHGKAIHKKDTGVEAEDRNED